jgi:hypothetical protein
MYFILYKIDDEWKRSRIDIHQLPTAWSYSDLLNIWAKSINLQQPIDVLLHTHLSEWVTAYRVEPPADEYQVKVLLTTPTVFRGLEGETTPTVFRGLRGEGEGGEKTTPYSESGGGV